MRKQHPNNVLVEEGRHIVRNESRYLAGTGFDSPLRLTFNLYHACEKGMTKTRRSAGPSDVGDGTGRWVCNDCTRQAPDVVQGYMNLIDWSMEDADRIR